ncbi:glycosyltransferase family 71 protein [Piromyces sp. E2]|nr:glycosyltransferase family 71 protein [Piromyces sp. E2]|eukprot:OUM67819.1 glycosyltransferase family 71 protein [Piromyces sp. E2]
MLATLHQSLYPWVYGHKYKSFRDIIETCEGRGIVMCVGNKHFNFARSAIDTLRYVIKTDLPIEIFYNGKNDLEESKRKTLSEFENVYLTDISNYFDNNVINLGGWAIKPFSILASRFEEVILIDADSVFIRDPAILFEDEGYLEKGTVFFRDRTLFPGSHKGSKWLKSWMIDPLPETRESRYWNEKTSHEMESSTVVINKPKTILGLLTVCKLNEKKIRDNVVYKHVHGDKETFWIGFDMARQPYNMLPGSSLLIGELSVGEAGDKPDERQICGHVGHTARDGKLLYWNDHIVKNKNDAKNKDRLLRFEAYFIEDGEGEWPNFHCQNLNIEDKGKGNPTGKEPEKFSEEERKVLEEIVRREKEHRFVTSADSDKKREDEEKKEKEEKEEI